jgi:exonuclease III
MAYVILSRITSIQQLYIKEFDQSKIERKIYCNVSAKKEAQRLRACAINIQTTEWDKKRPNFVRISSLNARSLQQHYKDLQKDEFIMKSDIICIQETWLEAEPKEKIPWFKTHYLHGRSKGIAVFTKLEPIQVESFQRNSCSIIKATFIEFDLFNVYRFSGENSIIQFTEEVCPLIDLERMQIIVGDMNIDLLKTSHNFFTHSLEQKGFEQMVRRPTHVLGGLIDHVYFFSPNMEASCTLYKQHTVFWSDHTCQSLILQHKPDCE